MHETPQHVTTPIHALRVVSEPHPCVYLPDRVARHEYLFSRAVDPIVYHRLMDMNFRRAGTTIYRPCCADCTLCRQLRIPAASFRPNRAQRRNRRMNRDVDVRIGVPELSDERWLLYRRYQFARHAEESESVESLDAFLYTSSTATVEFRYHLHGRLIMAAIADVCRESLSAVYCYYDPLLMSRGLGTLNILTGIDFARTEGVPYVYLGYWIRDSRKMSYKTRFRPCEVLGSDGRWTPHDPQ